MKKCVSLIAIAVGFLLLGTPIVQAQTPDGQSKSNRSGQRRFQRGGNSQSPGSARNGDRRQGRNPAEIAKMMFGRMDKNQDGFISESEMPERARKRFVDMDKNQDGNVDAKELQAAFAMRMGQGKAGSGKNGSGMNGQRRPGQGKAGKGQAGEKMRGKGSRGDMAKMMFDRFDKDGDGAISSEEAPERMKQRFAQIDTNGDSKIDAKELAQISERMKNKAADGGKRTKGQGDRKDRSGSGQSTKPQKPKRPPQAEPDGEEIF